MSINLILDDTVQLTELPTPDPFSDMPALPTTSDRDPLMTDGDGAEVTVVPVSASTERLSRRRAHVTVVILFLVNLLNYMDRFTVAGVLDRIEKYYSMDNKSYLGLLQTSFILSYMILSPIFGYLGDRYVRKYLMSGGILFWSAVTLTSSFMTNFWVFMIFRALVGIGEASYSTIAPTLIADLFSKEKRSQMLMLFYFAIPVGSGLGYILSSNIATLTGHWQWALRVTPILGVICVVLIMFVVREPERGEAEGGTHLSQTSYLTDLKELVKNKSFILSSFGFTCVAFVTGALAFWAPLFMQIAIKVETGVNADEAKVGLVFGIITCAAGFIGVALGIESARRLKRRNPRGDPLVCAFGMLCCTPFLYFALIASRYSQAATWVLIFFGETMLCLNWAIVADMLLYVVLPTRRSTAESFQILMSHALGDAGSPYLVGLISNSLEGPGGLTQYTSLQYALFTTTFVCVIGGAFFLATALFIDQDKAKVDKAVKGHNDNESISSELDSDGMPRRDGLLDSFP